MKGFSVFGAIVLALGCSSCSTVRAKEDPQDVVLELLSDLGFSRLPRVPDGEAYVQKSQTWQARYPVEGNGTLSTIYLPRDEAIIVHADAVIDRRNMDERAGRIPEATISAASATAKLKMLSSRVWGDLPRDETVAVGSYTNRSLEADRGEGILTSRLLHAGFVYPGVNVTIRIDMENGELFACTRRMRMPKFPAKAPRQWVPLSVAVGAAFPDSPRVRNAEGAELQWFEPSLGLPCRLCWVLTRGKEQVYVDAVTATVHKRVLYKGVLRDDGLGVKRSMTARPGRFGSVGRRNLEAGWRGAGPDSPGGL